MGSFTFLGQKVPETETRCRDRNRALSRPQGRVVEKKAADSPGRKNPISVGCIEGGVYLPGGKIRTKNTRR